MSKPQNSLLAPLQFLKGVGPERSKILAKLGLITAEDLLYFFPRRYENRQPVKPISGAIIGQKQCVTGTIQRRGVVRRGGGPPIFRAVITDGKKNLQVLFFNQPYLAKLFIPQTRAILFGLVEEEGKNLQMIHPEYEILQEDEDFLSPHFGRVVPIYSLTEDLSQKGLRGLAYRAVGQFAPVATDPLPSALKKRLGFISKSDALRQVHFPDSFENLKMAYQRLVFDEFLMMQTVIQLKKRSQQKITAGLVHATGEEKVNQMLSLLPFKLTEGQERAITDVLTDMKKNTPMNRLVQGDVGSGKTVVACAALLFTVSNGFQGALMAPTEVLAQQLYFNLIGILEPFGVEIRYLGQGLGASQKKEILGKTACGQVKILIGTHALIQEGVIFKNLGLAVIDEQHKFGVFQREALVGKGMAGAAHFLLMTATPIPRTLAMTLYGDLEVTSVLSLPTGRQPIRTLWVGQERRTEIYLFLEGLIEKGGQAYVVCPLIDEKSPTLKNVEMAHRELSKVFARFRVGMLHGRMKGPEKKKIMAQFKKGEIQILVSTVVIEVGVDVPNANIMVIESAEKFGLAQLHQLRGRVGRGREESYCILFSDSANPESIERLRVFEQTSSGFEIAEKDLRLRGAGDLAGDRQHGLADIRIGDLVKDFNLLQLANQSARQIVAEDPLLKKHSILRQSIKDRYGTL